MPGSTQRRPAIATDGLIAAFDRSSNEIFPQRWHCAGAFCSAMIAREIGPYVMRLAHAIDPNATVKVEPHLLRIEIESALLGRIGVGFSGADNDDPFVACAVKVDDWTWDSGEVSRPGEPFYSGSVLDWLASVLAEIACCTMKAKLGFVPTATEFDRRQKPPTG